MARSKAPWTAIFAGGLGTLALVRAFYHSKRVALDGGTAQQCPGQANCDPAVTLRAAQGAPVYAMAPGVVIAVSPSSIALAAADEPVVLDYTGFDQVQVQAGQRVGLGQQLGLAHSLRFAVYDAQNAPGGTPRTNATSPLGRAYEPASWLAVHGLRAAAGKAQPQWCDQPRQIEVPQQVAKCGIQLPTPSAWALLPVRVSLSQ